MASTAPDGSTMERTESAPDSDDDPLPGESRFSHDVISEETILAETDTTDIIDDLHAENAEHISTQRPPFHAGSIRWHALTNEHHLPIL